VNIAAKVVKHMATGLDGETYDFMRIIPALGGLALIVYTGYHMYAHGQFDPMSFGAGLGGLYGGTGIGLGAKAKTEPTPLDGGQRIPEER
jgi:hypothetical protein